MPDSWRVAKIRRRLRGIDGIRIGPFGSALTLNQMVEAGFKVYGQENVIADDFSVGTRFVSTSKYTELKACSVSPGDLLVTMMGTTGRCSVVPDNILEGIMDSHLIRLRFSNGPVDPSFVALLIDKGHYVKEQIAASGKGTIMSGLNSSIIKDIWIGLPDIVTQAAIVDFVQKKTEQIDRLIRLRRQQIGLLHEKRTAVIQQAVTRGLNPSAPLKDSGLLWLGEVPKHWEVKRIKYAATVESGHTPSRSVEAYWQNCDIPWVSLNDSAYLRHHDYIEETFYAISSLGIANSSARILPPRAVVFSRDATVGLCAITTVPMAVSQHFIAYLCGPRLIPEFLLFVLRSMTRELEKLSMGATISTIGMDDVRNLATPIPPLDEQKQICAHIVRSIRQIDAAVAAYRDQLTLLAEYRAALIHECVTGQRGIM
jgi:type I restriction enzyme S subunit